jgi:hypothetical protein
VLSYRWSLAYLRSRGSSPRMAELSLPVLEAKGIDLVDEVHSHLPCLLAIFPGSLDAIALPASHMCNARTLCGRGLAESNCWDSQQQRTEER